MSDITVNLSLECTPDDAEHILRFYSILNSSRIGDIDVLDIPYTAFSIGETLRYLQEYLRDLCENKSIRDEFLEEDSWGIVKEWLGEND